MHGRTIEDTSPLGYRDCRVASELSIVSGVLGRSR